MSTLDTVLVILFAIGLVGALILLTLPKKPKTLEERGLNK